MPLITTPAQATSSARADGSSPALRTAHLYGFASADSDLDLRAAHLLPAAHQVDAGEQDPEGGTLPRACFDPIRQFVLTRRPPPAAMIGGIAAPGRSEDRCTSLTEVFALLAVGAITPRIAATSR